ncbi:hypothetical protein [Candidatus Ponderosibacter sp. Uisw_141_02]|uniref:hypothetical protein n=1 Tax=Candidatus Ponderosibacter sp. Uisw_141_02 TaxID=3231000 RepID=UPI003D474359
MRTKSEKIAVFYAHFSKSKSAQKNYEYFIKNGLDGAAISTLEHALTKLKNADIVKT